VLLFLLFFFNLVFNPDFYTILCLQGAVTNSRQFPFRFFSAYEVLHDLEAQYEKNRMYI